MKCYVSVMAMLLCACADPARAIVSTECMYTGKESALRYTVRGVMHPCVNNVGINDTRG